MRIGIDFDNTIICYDKVFCELAKEWQLVDSDYQSSKQSLRDTIRTLENGELIWQRLQGKVYGEHIEKAELFEGFKEFISTANQYADLFIISHKTEFGHFDEKRISLRDAALRWLDNQNFFKSGPHYIPKTNIFFEATREEKLERIRALKCTHFIDDLIEVLDAPGFPEEIKSFLFQPQTLTATPYKLNSFSNWKDIQNAIFA